MVTSLLVHLKNNSVKLALFILIGSVAVNLLPSKDVNAQGTNVFFPVGTGYSDVIPHQIVRTNDDRVYIVGGVSQYQTRLGVYWTQQAGLPSANSFTGKVEIQLNVEPMSVEAAYDGADTIHLLVNTRSTAILYDYPFNIRTNTVKTPIQIAANSAIVSAGDYIGSSGVSGLFDKTGLLNIVYWQTGSRVVYQPFSYNATNNTLQPASAAFTVDINGKANHPVLAISPLDGSLTIAWVSEFTNPARILARSRTSTGTWGGEEVVSTAPVWTGVNAGISIDQGPSLVIDSAGTRHLSYIQNFDNTGAYGRVHYGRRAVTDTGWTDTALNTYSHDPAMALTNAGDVLIIGHGPDTNAQNLDIYVSRRKSDGTWGAIELVAKHTGTENFDSSPSVKWSVVGWNRPETIEFAFFTPVGNNYSNTYLYYGRLASGGTSIPTSTPLPTATLVQPTKTPLPTSTPLPTNTVVAPTKTPVPTSTVTAPTLTATTPPSTGVPSVHVDANPAAVNVGSTVAVTINLLNVTSFYGMQADCLVDPTKLAGTSPLNGTIFTPANSFFIDRGVQATGHWTIGATLLQPAPAFNGNGSAFVFQYKALAAGTTPITCDILAVDNKGATLSLQVTNGAVVINSAQATALPTQVVPTATATLVPTFTATPVPPTSTPIPPTATATAVVVQPNTPTPTTAVTGSIQGSVNYQQISNNAGINIQLNKDTTLVAQMVTLADGKYVFPNLAAGSYTLIISAPLHLTAVYQVTLSSTTPTVDLGNLVLRAGDTDGNQTIDLIDATFISANFTQIVPPAPANADLNRDGKVDIVDLVLVGGNFGLTGPIIIPPKP